MDLKKNKLSLIVKAIFYKTEIPAINIRKEWALSPKKVLPTPGMYRKYSETSLLFSMGGGIAALLLSAQILWSINIPYFERPTPLNTTYHGQQIDIDSSLETHVPAWCKVALFQLTSPLHSRMTIEELDEKYPAVMQYKYYLDLMSQAGLTHLIWLRFLLIAAFTGLVAYIGYCNSYRFLTETDQIKEIEGARVFTGEAASREVNKFLSPEYETFDPKITRFAEIADKVYAPESLRRMHAFIVGNSGAGKSQIAKPLIEASIAAGLKTVILDPGSEWTKYLFNENDPTMALIDPLDLRSHVWKFMADMKGIGFLNKFVASAIPSGGDQNKMWTNAARMVCLALFIFLQETYGDETTFKDVADVVQLSDEQIAYIVNKYYPHAARLVGELKEDGIEQNQTVSGIMINMISFMEYFMDLARYWNKPATKTISLYKFMTDPDYPIKTIIIRPNESEKRLARGITANVLAYLMNFIKEPELYGSKTVPVGNFFLDEFQSVGKIEDDSGDPVMQTPIQQGRKYGWGLFLLTQTIPEAERIYGKETVAGWRGTMGTQILAGAPLDKDITTWIDGFGDKKIEKMHLSKSTATDGGVSYSENWQEHIAKSMVATTLSKNLRNEKPWVKYLYIPNGASDLYFLRKQYSHIGENYLSFSRAPQMPNRITDDSRVKIAAIRISKGKDPLNLAKPQASVADRFSELEQEYADQDDAPSFQDYGQHADETIETEATLNVKFKKEYDITPTKEENDSILGDVVTDKVMEAMFDSPTINAVRQILELLSSSNKRLKTTDYKEKVKFEYKKRYANCYTGLELTKHDSKQ